MSGVTAGRSAAGFVPRLDDRLVSLPAEHRYRRRGEREEAALDRWLADPASGQDPQDVSVRKDKAVARARANPRNHAVDARRHLVDGLASGRTHAPDRPARPIGADLDGCPPLVAA